MTRPCFVGYIYILDRPTGFSDCGPTSSYLVRLRSNKKTTLAVTSATCRRNSPHSPPLLEAYRWKEATYPRTIFIHTASLNLPQSTTFPQRTSVHSLTWLVDFGLPYRAAARGLDRKLSRSSERIPLALEVSPTSGLARWAIKRLQSSLTDVTYLQITRRSMGRVVHGCGVYHIH
jgi:hypothetical protein